VTTTSTPPPPPSGGGKYAIIGILLLLFAGGLWWVTQPEDEGAPVVTRAAEAPPPPSNAYVNQIEIPEERPDLGPPVQEKTVVRRVVRRDDWECSGDIDRAAIRQAMRDYEGQVRSCYERGLKVNHILTGTLNVTLKLDNHGQVSNSQIGGSLHDRDVHACVRNVARGWHFPVPTGGNCAVIQVPFNMTPRQ
jgi:outer membrane biosynthesis protein TonB